MGRKTNRATLNTEITSTWFLFVTKLKREDGKHQEEEEEEEEVEEARRMKKNPSKYFQHQNEFNKFFSTNGKRKKNLKYFWIFFLNCPRETCWNTFGIESTSSCFSSLKKILKKNFFKNWIFFGNCPRKTYKSTFNTKSTLACFSS